MAIWGEVELLCRAVLEEGDKEARKITAQAKAEAERILAEAGERIEKEFKAEILAQRSQTYAEAKRLTDSAELESRKRIISFRENVMEEVFDALRERLRGFRKEPGYVAFLLKAVKEGMEALAGKEFLVEISPEDPDLVKSEIEKLAESISRKVEIKLSPSVKGGARVYTSDRTLLYDNSLPIRLKRLEDEIRREIWRVIFEAAIL